MRILSALLLGASSLLAASYVAAQEAPVGNVKILDELRSTRADIFSRVNLDRDLVVVGELDSIDYCELK